MSEAIHWTNETRRLVDLQPWPRNPRQINKDQARRLAQSFDEFGQVETIAIGPEGQVYNGHQRLSVLMDKHGGAHEVEVRVSSRPLSEKEREKLTVFLHKGAAGEFNFDVLANEFEFADLIDWGFDEKELLGAGFEQDEPEGEDPGAQVDKAEELRQKWGVETGQLWKLGEHRLICGDCTDKSVVDRVMGGERAHLCLTDPPYGNGWKYDEHEDTQDNLDDLIKAFMPLALDISDVVLLTPGNWNQRKYPEPTWTLCWFTAAGKGSGPWGFSCWQPILAYGKDPYLAHGKGRRPDALSLIEVSPDVDHPCPKPIKVWEWFLERGSVNVGDIVYEPFSGSGTTLIACERLSRKCRAVEISPAYCAVAIQRWVDMTGGVPELIAS